MKPYIESGKATLVTGDAMSLEDVSAAWKKASSQGTVDLVLFTVGKHLPTMRGILCTNH